MFQSTLLREERPVTTISWFQPSEFQSTLLREERPSLARDCLQEQIVSIHAPARGATTDNAAAGDGNPVSIHAPARGATGSQVDSTVSILVLLEVSLRQNQAQLSLWLWVVSILVLLEVSLRPPRGNVPGAAKLCFNPCFIGSISETPSIENNTSAPSSFNPCFIGSISETVV